MKGGKFLQGLLQVNMTVAKKIISDNIVTVEVKSEAERWYLKYTGHWQKELFYKPYIHQEEI